MYVEEQDQESKNALSQKELTSNFYKLKATLEETFRHDITTILSMINSLIHPILLYAYDYWECLKQPQNLNMMMREQVLGVQK